MPNYIYIYIYIKQAFHIHSGGSKMSEKQPNFLWNWVSPNFVTHLINETEQINFDKIKSTWNSNIVIPLSIIIKIIFDLPKFGNGNIGMFKV